MKKNIIDFLLLSVFWALIYFGINFILTKIGIQKDYILTGLLFTLFCISFTYKKWWSRETFQNKRILFILGFIFIFIFSGYTFSLLKRSSKLYSFVTTYNRRGWKGKVHQADSTLGYSAIPKAKGFHTFTIGGDIPMAYDERGFRIPLSDSGSIDNNKKYDMLFLGYSFTYGDACLAEETFPYIVAKKKQDYHMRMLVSAVTVCLKC